MNGKTGFIDIIDNMGKLYTRKGDDGYTSLLGEGRVPKYHPRPETFGTVDEATAVLGVARANCKATETGEILVTVQRDLYNLMAEIAATKDEAHKFRKIDPERVEWLEMQTDHISSQINIPNEFILPGDSIGGAYLAHARTVIRRAERKVAELLLSHEIENQALLNYLNRLSSLCFVLEILENQRSGKTSSTLAKGK